MRLSGRRMSNNVDDRRGKGVGGKVAGVGGVAGLIIAALFVWLSGGNPMDVISQSGFSADNIINPNQADYVPTAEEEQLATFASQILAGTEDVWSREFKKMGLEYKPPKMVLFTGSVQSGCGGATSSTGPFYCSADQTVYIDLSFFKQMEQQMGAGGDFAYAYVIAHEVGHHVQYLLGTLTDAHELMARSSKSMANQISVRLELQADFYAGIWAYNDNEMFQSLEPGDIEEGINAASKIGDDYLQRQAQGFDVPDSFTHGRSDQRVKWLKRGATTGDISLGDTFSPAYSSL
ncbi:MAG: neutral zinc metallopeptidase [Muribaculaceae bacterium]|nr:neutral zinc metallopeptidase [Muribaculaceae bacterium]